MKKSILIIAFAIVFLMNGLTAYGESPHTIFDDKILLEGYSEKYAEEPMEILLVMMQDDTLTSYKMAAAVRVFKEKFSREIFTKEKAQAERILWRRLNRTDSSFVKIEIMHTLCIMDRYRYFKYLIPDMIQELDHYNKAVNELCYDYINEIIKSGHNRPREATVVFNTLRKILFLSRKKLKNIKDPGPRLKQKLELIRWSVKILGNAQLKRLPSEVINLL